MRLSHLFFRTLRDTPADADTASHALLLRAGYVRQLTSGIFSLLPLGHRVAANIEGIIRAEMDALGAQEMAMPVVQPAALWRRSGRYDAIGSELARLRDRNGRDLVLALTHEEAATDLAADIIRDHRQLPMSVYQFQTKFRDEARSRAGLIRVREFTMKDAYSFDLDEAGLEVTYAAYLAAYRRIFARLGLEVAVVASDAGAMGGSSAHEFMVLTAIGEDRLVLCTACGYAANAEVAGEVTVCPACGAAVAITRGVEVGNTFRLGTRYSAAMGATYRAADGAMQPLVMGSTASGSAGRSPPSPRCTRTIGASSGRRRCRRTGSTSWHSMPPATPKWPARPKPSIPQPLVPSSTTTGA